MDSSVIGTLISTVGFPIAACATMGIYVKYITDKNDVTLKELNKSHQLQIRTISTALTNNTLALQDLAMLIKISNKGVFHE